MISLVPQPGSLQRPVELEDERRSRKGRADLVGGVEDETQVLLLEVDRESGLPVVRDHLRTAVGQHPRPGRTAFDGIERACQIEPRCLGEEKRLGCGELIANHQDLIDELGELAVPHRSQVGDGGRIALEYRPRPRHVGFAPANHGGEGSLDGSFRPTAHRCIEPVDFSRDELERQPSGLKRGDGGVIDYQLSLAESLLEPRHDFDDIGGVRDTDGDDIAAFGEGCQICGLVHLEPVGFTRSSIPYGRAISLGHQVGDHAPTHDPQSYKPDSLLHPANNTIRLGYLDWVDDRPTIVRQASRWPYALVVMTILLLLAGFLAVRAIVDRIPTVDDISSAFEGEPFEEVGPVVIRSIRELANLTTVEYVEYTIVEKGTNSGILNWATGDSLTLLAVARIGAGVDLSALDASSFDVDLETGEVVVRLPAADIQYVAVDNEATQVLDRSTGVFRQGDPRLETDARQVAEDVLVEQARVSGIIEEAEGNAAEVLTNFLLGLGYSDVAVVQTG